MWRQNRTYCTQRLWELLQPGVGGRMPLAVVGKADPAGKAGPAVRNLVVGGNLVGKLVAQDNNPVAASVVRSRTQDSADDE